MSQQIDGSELGTPASSSRPTRVSASHSVTVAAKPVADPTAFTWARVRARQCVKGTVYMATSSVKEHFQSLAVRVLAQCNASVSMPKPAELSMFMQLLGDDALAENVVLKVQYAQLVKCDPIDAPEREVEHDYVPEFFDCFEVDGKAYVQAPNFDDGPDGGGWYAVINATTKLHWTVELSFHIGLDVLCIESHRRVAAHLYTSTDKVNEICIKVTLNAELLFLKSDNLRRKLFEESNWPGCAGPPARVRPVPSPVPFAARAQPISTDMVLLHNMFEHEGKMCISVTESREEITIAVANFHIVEILEIAQFDQDFSPLIKILVRHELDKNGCGVFYLAESATERTPNVHGFQFIEVETSMNPHIFKTKGEVAGHFFKAYAMLSSWKLTPEMLGMYLASVPRPLPTKLIVYWGMQDSGWWIYSNIAFIDGRFERIEKTPHAYSTRFFVQHEYAPQQAKDFPKAIVIPYTHVRWEIGRFMWHEMIPLGLLNNATPAKAAFALVVLNMHASKLWEGESGMGDGVPLGWVWCKEMGVGKTLALRIAQAPTGCEHRAVWGGCSSKVMVVEAVTLERNMAKLMDDFVPKDQMEAKNSSHMWKEISRQIHDHTTRNVQGKLNRLPESSVIVSSNAQVNTDDAAAQSRFITIQFMPQNGAEAHDFEERRRAEPEQYNFANIGRTSQLLTSLAPDFALVGLWNGELDAVAIGDLNTFLTACVGVSERHRCAGNGAKHLFILLLLTRMFQGDPEELLNAILWSVQSVALTAVVCANPGTLNRFILAIYEVLHNIQASPLGATDRVLYWHNIRWELRPPIMSMSDSTWLAVKVGSVCAVLRHHGFRFSEVEILNAAAQSNKVVRAKAKFYNTQAGGNVWPIAEKVYEPPDSTSYTLVPMPEYKLQDESMLLCQALFFSDDYLAEMREHFDHVHKQVDPRTVVIKSKFEEWGDYNLVEAVRDWSWFGYRSLHNQGFSYYNGILNEAVDYKPGFDKKMFHSAELLKHFSYEIPDPTDLPREYTELPYRMDPGGHTPPCPSTEHMLPVRAYSPQTPDRSSADEVSVPNTHESYDSADESIESTSGSAKKTTHKKRPRRIFEDEDVLVEEDEHLGVLSAADLADIAQALDDERRENGAYGTCMHCDDDGRFDCIHSTGHPDAQFCWLHA